MFGLLNPKRALYVHSAKPLNAEPPLDRLRGDYLTDVADFYIRSHGDMPDLDGGTHTLRVTGQVARPFDFTVDDLKARFEPRTVVAVLQCAGNRRADLQSVERTTGDPWAPGAIGNAEWTGVALADVLHAAGASGEGLHVAFEGADTVDNEGADNAPYGVSIPIRTAVSRDVLLVWAMNDQPLSREHGAPLRVVVPGHAGVRSTKWLREIRVQDQPSDAFQQAHDYLLFPPDMREATVDLSRGITINEMPLNSAICEPAPGATLARGSTMIRGYAMATDRAITRIDVSINGGRHWRQATIEEHGDARWGWTLWHTTLDIPAGEHELVVRAWDSAGQTQPAHPADIWNFKGYLSAAWHRIRVTVV